MIPCLCSFIALLRKYDKQKTYPNPCRFEYELYGGELGTRTPDPLRVMHDDFSIFLYDDSLNTLNLLQICYKRQFLPGTKSAVLVFSIFVF